jgi:hypothetical protein
MKLVRRITGIGLTAALVILFFAVLIEWRRGCSRRDSVDLVITTPPLDAVHQTDVGIHSDRDGLSFSVSVLRDDRPDPDRIEGEAGALWFFEVGDEPQDRHGVECAINLRKDAKWAQDSIYASAPHWLLAIFFGWFPARGAVHWVTRRHHKHLNGSISVRRRAPPSKISGIRVKSRLLRLSILVSALSCISLIVLWMRIGGPYDSFEFVRSITPRDSSRRPTECTIDQDFVLQSHPYGIRSSLASDRDWTPAAKDISRFVNARTPQPRGISDARWKDDAYRHAFILDRSAWKSEFTSSVTVFCQAPHTAAIAIAAILPSIYFLIVLRRWSFHLHRRLRVYRWRRSKLCPVCRYDLRASPQKCPECGNAVQARTRFKRLKTKTIRTRP